MSWFLLRYIHYCEKLNDCQILKEITQLLQCHANAQAGCERENSTINQYKQKHSSSMKLPMMQARSRVKCNGPPLHLFSPAPVLQYWLQNNHRLAHSTRRKDDISMTIRRLRENASAKLKTKLFIL